jgi:hypothetical protein
MTEVHTNPPVEGTVLHRLQSAAASALLGLAPLPGGGELHFPDLPFLLRQPWIPVLDENVAGPLLLGGNLQLRLLSPEQLQEETARAGQLSYLRFAPPVRTEQEIRIPLEVWLASADQARSPTRLGGVVVTFAQKDGDWQAVETPAVMAD